MKAPVSLDADGEHHCLGGQRFLGLFRQIHHPHQFWADGQQLPAGEQTGLVTLQTAKDVVPNLEIEVGTQSVLHFDDGNPIALLAEQFSGLQAHQAGAGHHDGFAGELYPVCQDIQRRVHRLLLRALNGRRRGGQRAGGRDHGIGILLTQQFHRGGGAQAEIHL